MKATRRFLLFFLFMAGTAIHGWPQSFSSDVLEDFEFQGQKYYLIAGFSTGRADIILQGASSANLSADLEGENILLGTVKGAANFYIFWLNSRPSSIGSDQVPALARTGTGKPGPVLIQKPRAGSSLDLVVYDLISGRSRPLDLSGFSFIGLPRIIEENGILRALFFLGNRSDNDDIFYYEPDANLLLPLTQTPFSEKNFSFEEKDGLLEIETKSLWAQYRYRFNRRLLENVLLEEKFFSSGQKNEVQPSNFSSVSTYIGFGDSITWGQIEGIQRLDLCYLTQLQALLAPRYGPWSFINLGVPGLTTYTGAQRVDQDLAKYSAQYFLLMLGVNDVFLSSFSLAGSLENLKYIVDAALARGLHVIISTLTPRKDEFSFYSYYWENLRALSRGILDLAKEKHITGIDTLTAFMDSNPPDGWKMLLENIIPEISKGNHPNQQGHRVIAELFAASWVTNDLPVPKITVGNSEIYWQDLVNFSGTGSYDPDGSIEKYEWDFADGETALGMQVSHRYTKATAYGDLTVKLTVTDNKGLSASTTKTINVKPRPFPVIKSDQDEVFWQDTVVFDGRGSLTVDSAIVAYEWNFADREYAAGIQVAHKFANNIAYGDLPVQLTVINAKGVSASTTKTIKVKPRPVPVISADKDEVFWQDTVVFDGRHSLVLPGFTVAYSWDFADGEYAQGMQVSHKFAKADAFGDKTVKLTIVDNNNVSASAVKTIRVNALYTAPTTFEKKKIRTLFYNRWGYSVSWTANAKNAASGYQIVKYRLFRKAVSSAGDYTQIAEVDAAVNRYLDLSIDQTTAYVYAACAVDAQGRVSPVNHF